MFYTAQENVEGSYIDLVNELSKQLNFQPLFFRIKKPLWSELIRSLSAKEYDLSATIASMTYKRNELVDFSIPITTTSYV